MRLPDDTVMIDRWQIEYQIPRDHPSPERLKGRLDDAVSDLSKDLLKRALQPLMAQEGSKVWLIRRLELNLGVNASQNLELSTRAWAAQMAKLLDRTFQSGSDGENVLCFPDWSAYLAHFLEDLMGGQAWGCWYYKAFEGLRMLPFSAAARTALLDDPQVGFKALMHLHPDRSRNLAASLSRQDALRVLDGLAGVGTNEPDDFDQILLACQKISHVNLPAEAFAFLLYLEIADRVGQPGGTETAVLSRAIAHLHHRLSEGGDDRLAQAILATARGDLTDLSSQLGSEDAERLRPLLACPPARLPDLITALKRGEPRNVDTPDKSPRRSTSFGGSFFLLPELDRLPLKEMLTGFPPLEDENAEAAMRLLLLVRASGTERSIFFFSDLLLRDLLGVGPRFSMEKAVAWLNQIHPVLWEHFSTALLRANLHDLARESPLLGLVRVNLAEETAIVLVNVENGSWFGAIQEHEHGQALPNGILPILENYANAQWLGDPELITSIKQVLRNTRNMPEVLEKPGHSDHEIPLTRLRQVPDDLHYLLAPATWRLSTAPDLALALAAQRMIRSFSHKLVGFEQSGLAYLFTNFLNFNAGLEQEPERCTVLLGRPPLALVLQRAGQFRSSYHLTWGLSRRFDLFPEA
jgi:hypothetical protein